MKKWAEERKEQREQHRSVAQRARQLFGSQPQSLVGPGDQHPGGPRHSNDKENVAEIDVVPTQDEILCRVQPFLPPNRPGTVLHLPPGPAAHIDVHFRLMRHDIIAPLLASVGQWTEGSEKKQVGSGRRLQVPGGGDSVLWAFTNAQVVNLTSDSRNGMYFEIEFDPPEHLQRQSVKQQQDYWERSRRLSHGTLVCLAFNDATEGVRIVILTICEREKEKMAPKNGGRAKIGVSLPKRHGSDTSEYALLAQLLQSGAYATLLQSSGSFFAYAPFLKALQKMNEVPLGEYLIRPAPGATEKDAAPSRMQPVEAPLYLQMLGSITLTALVDKAKEAELIPAEARLLKDQLSSVSISGPFPDSALEQLTTLDRVQRQALKAS